MAKKKKKTTQQTFLSPEKYLIQKARSLKIKVCYKTDTYETEGLGFIIVVREHVGGKITFGSYMVDKFCLGVKDTHYYLRMEPEMFSLYLDKIAIMGLREISYEEAHNIIYGAVEFAREAGIEPHKNFKMTQYILEEDTEDIPLIEYEYGKDGKHFLVANSNFEASKYLPTMKKNLGDNFDWMIDEDEDEEEYGNDDVYTNDLSNHPIFKKYGPNTIYTYKHPEYPSSMDIKNPIVENILCDPKNAIVLSSEQIGTLLALPHESLRHDLEQLIMYNVGVGCDGIPDDISDADFVGVICNAIILLGEVGNEDSSLDVVLEVLRQSEDFYDYHVSDIGTETFVPTIYKLGRNRLDKLMSFMKEEGLYDFAKLHVPSAVASVARRHPERREEVLEWFRELVSFATVKLPEAQYIDSVVAGGIVNNLADIKAAELLPELKALFETGLVDEGFCGRYDSVIKEISNNKLAYKEEYITDVYERFDDINRQFGNN